MPRAVASAPGKAILAGEHAAVWGRPALVAAIGLRLRVEARVIAGGAHRIVFGDTRHEVPLERVRHEGDRARAAWQQWCDDPKASLGTKDPLTHVAVTLAELEDCLGHATLPALELTIDSAIPLGAGLGSSAALAIAILQAGAAVLGTPLDHDALFAASLAVERLQHGRPSGIDNAAVLYGGVSWAERIDGNLAVTPIVCSGMLEQLALADSGRPHETTGEVVASVRRLAAEHPATVDAANDRIETATRGLRTALETGQTTQLGEAIRTCGAALESLGVVPPEIRHQLTRLGQQGVAAKISGAGALSGRAAGAVLAFDPLHTFDPHTCGWSPLTTTLGAPGARLEEHE